MNNATSSVLTISAKHSMIQWTSFLLRCLSQEVKTECRGITSRKWVADILAARREECYDETPKGTCTWLCLSQAPILYIVVNGCTTVLPRFHCFHLILISIRPNPKNNVHDTYYTSEFCLSKQPQYIHWFHFVHSNNEWHGCCWQELQANQYYISPE